MIRLSCQDLEACSRAMQGLYAEPSLEAFPDRVFETLSKLVPAEHITYNELSDQTRPVQVRCFPQRPEIQPLVPQLAAVFHTHPLARYASSTVPTRLLDVATVREFSETAAYREYYRLVNVTEQMIFALETGKRAPRVTFAFNRFRRHFSDRDLGVVSFLAPHISQAYRNARALAAMADEINQVAKGLDAINRAVIVARGDGQICWLSTLAREWLRELFPDFTNLAKRLPPVFQSRMLLAKTKRTPAPGSTFELQLPIGPEQQLMVRFVPIAEGMLLVALERERSAIGRALVDSMDLTPREAEILFWISEAKTNPEIATILGISPRTVHKHVEHLFAKLGVANRGAAQRLGWDARRL